MFPKKLFVVMEEEQNGKEFPMAMQSLKDYTPKDKEKIATYELKEIKIAQVSIK